MNISATLTAFAVVLMLVPSLGAQNAVVYYDHRPGDTTLAGRVTYLRPGEQASVDPAKARRHVGLPPIFRIAQGSSVCVVVENANPLLYSYTAASKTVTVDPPAELAPFLTSVAHIIDAIGETRPTVKAVSEKRRKVDTIATAHFAPVGSKSFDSALLAYADSVRRLAEIAQTIADVKARSDWTVTLTEAAREANSLRVVASATNEGATRLFNKYPDTVVFKLVHEVHVSTWSRLEAAAREIADAHVAIAPTFCAPLEGDRLRTTLSIARKVKLGEGQTAARPANDSTISIVSDPVSIRVFEIVPAGVFSFEVRDRRRFSVEGGVVKGRSDHRAFFNPGVFALGWVRGPVWATLGVAKSDATAPDLFLGISLRGGDSLVGTNIILGFGLSLAQVVVGLKEGREGAALPANVADVETIVDREYRPGLGVIFTLSGLSFAKKDKAKE